MKHPSACRWCCLLLHSPCCWCCWRSSATGCLQMGCWLRLLQHHPVVQLLLGTQPLLPACCGWVAAHCCCWRSLHVVAAAVVLQAALRGRLVAYRAPPGWV